ncbi:MAG: phosphate ABC transporter substrate-binding protein, partial [bacterium]|nr:phosphate ABC transporter substrate-binding protein [bacterium]
MKKTGYLLSILSLSLLLTAGCSRKSGPSVTLAGSTAFQPFAEKLAEKYMETHKGIRINVQGGGSAVGIQSALAGNAQIGMADLPELPAEAKELTSIVVARDGIAVVVNPVNPIFSLSSEQVKGVFTGKITNWKAIGGMDAALRVISREDGSGTRRSFDALALNNEKISPAALFQNSNGTIREAVANDPNAVGYLSIG